MRKKKKSLIFIITLLIMCFGIGYAYLTTTLSINGTTDIDSNTWDVHWENIQVTSGSVTGDQVLQSPTIGSDETSVSFHIRLKEPGEFYEFTVDAKNDGTIPAMIDTISKTINNSTTIPDYLYYSVTYSDGFPIQNDQMLSVNEKETYMIRIEYKTDLTVDDLPSTAQSLSLSFGISYAQSFDNNQYTRVYYLGEYSNWYDQPREGAPYPDTTIVYNTLQLNDYPVFFMTPLKNDIIDEVYVGIKLNNRFYYLRGGGATYNEGTGNYNWDSIYYDDNVAYMKANFDEDRCHYGSMAGVEFYVCSYLGYTFYTMVDGYVSIGSCNVSTTFGCGG